MSIILLLSGMLNMFLIWYVYRILYRQTDLVALVEDLEYKIFLFSKHIENVYQLPMYYGEPTIESLISHSKTLLSSFEQFNEDYIDFMGEEEYEQLQEKTKEQE